MGKTLSLRRLELGGQYEFVERHGDGVAFAFRTIYEFALQDYEPDEILFGPLAKYVRGDDSATINAFFIGQVGNEAEIDSLELKLNWQLKHELNEKWGQGVEGYGEIEDLSRPGTFNEQAHRIGPVAYYEFGGHDGRPKWEFAAGPSFGISDVTSDVTFKFDHRGLSCNDSYARVWAEVRTISRESRTASVDRHGQAGTVRAGQSALIWSRR